MEWVREQPPIWDEDKVRIVGEAPSGIFDVRFRRLAIGTRVPGEWWRVVENGRIVGYGWLDVVWGDAEILLAVDREARGNGVGSFILAQLQVEAKKRGLNRLYNTVRSTHPERSDVTRWLEKHGFSGEEDGTLDLILKMPALK